MTKGQHIRVKRVGYYHHGIDIGKRRVIHFTGEPGSKSDASILETGIADILDGGELEIVEYAESFPINEIVERAKSRLGETKYNLAFNNCEHFARWCVTGQHKSEQVTQATGRAGATVGTGVLASSSLTVVSSVGSAAGLSGAGIMSGLAAIGPGGVVGGVVTLSAAPAVLANVAISKTLKDDDKLPESERNARKKARVVAKAGSVAGAAGSVAAISASGTVAGLSGAGISSGLAAIGGTVGGGMATGVAVTVAAPAVIAIAAGFGLYKFLSRKKEK